MTHQTTDPTSLSAAFQEWMRTHGLPNARNILSLGEGFNGELAIKILLQQSFLEGAMHGALIVTGTRDV